MFCPSCGTEYSIELNYCNRCGANLTNALAPAGETATVNINKAVAVIGTTLAVLTLGGFMAIILGAVSLAKNTAMGTDPIMMMILMGMITILTTDIFLVRQLSRLISASLSSNKPTQIKRSPAPTVIGNASASELARPITARLEPGASVTENTTRFLEAAYRAPSDAERKTPESLKN